LLDAALKSPPAGVQIWSSCVGKENAFEFGGGSLFIEAFCQVLEHKGIKGIQEPTSTLPMDLLQTTVKEYLEMALNAQKLKQTPRLVGQDGGKGAESDPDAPLATALVIRPAPAFKGGLASREMIQGILDEIEALPPPQGGVGPRLTSAVLPP